MQEKGKGENEGGGVKSLDDNRNREKLIQMWTCQYALGNISSRRQIEGVPDVKELT